MRYADFRDRLEDALLEEGLFFPGADRRVETIDLSVLSGVGRYMSTERHGRTEPFHVSAVIGFKWSPVDAARAYSCEEDHQRQYAPWTKARLLGRSGVVAVFEMCAGSPPLLLRIHASEGWLEFGFEPDSVVHSHGAPALGQTD